MEDSKNLHIDIELLRKSLIESGMKYGLTAPQTVDLSQALDQLLNVQQVY